MKSRASLPLFLILLMAGCASHPAVNETPIGAVIQIKPPLGLPPVPIPAGNPETVETVSLGRRLFYDKRLSRDNTLSCAACHDPGLGFSDGRRQSVGVNGKIGSRNAPSLINAAYLPLQFWDGRAASLEEQSVGPMANPIEMDQKHDVMMSKLSADGTYQLAFEKAFGPGPITLNKIQNALAAFERTLISGNSPFDRYQYGGDKTALSSAAVRGLAVFVNPRRGNCVTCHVIGGKYALFTDGRFHNTGAGVDGEGALTDVGRFAVTNRDADRGTFMTPTLRNVAQSAPYMHDGSLKTLKEVVDFYAGNGNSNPTLDKEIKAIKLTGQDRADLVEFLKSLTGELPPDSQIRASK